MQVWNMLNAARCKCRTQKNRQKVAICAPSYNFVGPYLATKARIDNRKKLIKQQYLLQMSEQYGGLRPTSGWDRSGSLGHPANFNGFCVLTALLHGSQVVSVSQTLQRWTEGPPMFGRATIRLGIGPHSSFSFTAKYISNWLMSHRSHPQIITFKITFKGARPIFYHEAGKFDPCTGRKLEIWSSY